MGEAVISSEHRRHPGCARASSIARGTLTIAVTAVALVLVAGPLPARAATTSEQSSSILIFPKVVFDGSRDTVIQITNTSNSMVHAHCFYVNAAPLCIGAGDCLAGTCSGTCEPQWIEVDFAIWLTKQQPTHWSVGEGRLPPGGFPCDATNSECDNAGIEIGRVPPVSSVPFAGELRCIEVDQSGAPISGNHLKGEATIISGDGDASKYNAVGLIGEPFSNNGDDVLCIGGGVTDECPSGAEYEGCGQRLIMPNFAEGADNPMFGPSSEVDTELTLTPCTADFERQLPSEIVVQVIVVNEFEQPFSTSQKFTCWLTTFLDDINGIFSVLVAQTRFIETQLRPADKSDSGFVGVYEEYHRVNGQQARAAFNIHEQGTRDKTDLIFLPEGP